MRLGTQEHVFFPILKKRKVKGNPTAREGTTFTLNRFFSIV